MALDSLPSELIRAICDFCDTAEVKCIRLTCHILRNIANGYLISEVELEMTRDSLEACKGIAAHQVFSRTATSLWIDAEITKQMTFRDWKQECERQNREVERQRGGTQAPIAIIREEESESVPDAQRGERVLLEDQLWSHYVRAARLAYESAQMLHDQSWFKTLQNVLSSCPRIGSLGLSAPEGRMDAEFDEQIGVDTMARLILAASAISFKPTDLYLDCVSHGILSREDIFDQILDFFRDLKKLKWDFFCPEMSPGFADTNLRRSNVERESNSGNFAKVVQAAAGIEILHVSFPVYLNLSVLAGNYHWQQLAHIHLKTVKTRQTQLVDFLLDHKSTLQTVSLEDIWIEDGSWPEFFACIAGKLPRLVGVELQGAFEGQDADHGAEFYDFGYESEYSNPDEYARTISEYVIKGGDKFPSKPKEMQREEDDTAN